MIKSTKEVILYIIIGGVCFIVLSLKAPEINVKKSSTAIYDITHFAKYFNRKSITPKL